MVPSPYRRADAERFVREVVPAQRAAGTGAPFGVFRADTATLVGTVGLLEIAERDEPVGGRAGIGYWTAPWARRCGYTTEAVGAVCRWGFEELGVAVISWEAIVGNEGSWAVARRNGFVREGPPCPSAAPRRPQGPLGGLAARHRSAARLTGAPRHALAAPGPPRGQPLGLGRGPGAAWGPAAAPRVLGGSGHGGGGLIVASCPGATVGLAGDTAARIG
jgi:hypothetical protein